MMKKTLSVLLATVMLLVCIPLGAIPVAAATSGTTGDCTWTLNGTHLTISGNGAMGDCNSLLTSKPWGWNIISVTIEDGVTTIGEYAFYGCDSLTSVTIPNSVTSIGEYALSDCTALMTIDVDKNNPCYCSLDGVLFNNDKTELVQYPSGKTNVSYVIPNSVTTIGQNAFYNCDYLTSMTIPDSVTTIGENAFVYCSQLTSVIIGNGVTTIEGNAFGACANLTSLIIGDSVATIEHNAFVFCTSLTSVTIPSSVTRLDCWFQGCSSLRSINVEENNPHYYSVDGVLFEKLYFTTLVRYPMGKTDISAYAIPNDVTYIHSGAFHECSALKSITIPERVTNIYDSAFQNCSSLVAIDVNENNRYLSSVDGVLFNKNKTKLIVYPNGKRDTSYTIPDSVTSIEEDAFYNCTALTSVTIGNSVTSIGSDAFFICTALTDVHYNGTEQDKTAISIGSSNTSLINATWHYYDTQCDVDCNMCGITRETIHTYTNTCDRDCNVCGITRVVSHQYDGVCDGQCNLCGFRRKAEAHTYDGICDDQCNICSEQRDTEPHSYDNDCDAVCNGCGLVRIVPDHVYDYICDADCNVCGLVRETSHTYDDICEDIDCNVCGHIRESHAYTDSCDIDCNVCGAIREAEHDYDNACDDTCDTCGWWRDVPDHVYDDEYDANCNECGAIREVEMLPVTFGGNSVSKEVSGLAFKFTVDAIGMTTTNGTTAVYDNATVNGYKLLSMGAIVSNAVESVDIPAVYLFDWSDTDVTYAVRLINIPADQYDTVITATPYFVLEIDGVATTIYGEAQTASMNGVMNA